MNAINCLYKTIYDMQPDGIGVKICATIPVVSSIVLMIKEKKLIKNVNDNYCDVTKISELLVVSHETNTVEYKNNWDKINLPIKNCITHLGIYDEFVTNMAISIYSFVPRIVLIAALVFVPLSVPVWWGTAAILSLTIIPHFNIYFPSHQKYLNYLKIYKVKTNEILQKLDEVIAHHPNRSHGN